MGEVAAEGGWKAPSEVPIERAKRPEHGDFASNVALALAKGPAGRRVRWRRRSSPDSRGGDGSPLAEVGIAGPGFINLRLAPSFWQGTLADDPDGGGRLGASGAERATPRILLEYLSANPTGPIHVAHGRHAAVGDALVRLLRFAGYPVTSEFYVNDAGNQVQMLALSVWARYVEAARQVDPAIAGGAVPRKWLQGRLRPRLRAGAARARRDALGGRRAARRHRPDQAASRSSARST